MVQSAEVEKTGTDMTHTTCHVPSHRYCFRGSSRLIAELGER
jgi:hypothetical protein